MLDISIKSKTTSQIVKEQCLSAFRPLTEVKTLFLQEPLILSREIGGAKQDRTADLLRAKQVLSQLSYGPDSWWVWVDSNHRPHPYQGCALTN